MDLSRLFSQHGYSLVELVVVIIIIGIIASISITSMNSSTETVRVEKTKKELEQLAFAIAGNPKLISGGFRTDFGYVGDIGAMPSNLDDLVQNPGGYTTWDGPYIHDDYYASAGASEVEFKIDAWGTVYTYTGGASITSQGGTTPITREIAPSLDHILRNTVSVVVIDVDNTPPGTINRDSVRMVMSYPNGSGAITTRTKYPAPDGYVQFDSIPIGSHRIRIVYLPDSDTLTRIVSVGQGQNCHLTVSLFGDFW
ncbi:MAG: prepilin-type N-terminal cleavage/methylation domain-containing protein [bacterium]